MEDRNTTVYYPDTLNELLQLYRRSPAALLYAGGTYVLSHRPGRFLELPATVLSIQDVDELRRVSRSERMIELGAGMTIARILELGEQNIPRALYAALSSIGPPGVRGIATIGGNLAIPARLMTTVPVLILLDARIELRRQGRVRWLPVSRFHLPDGRLDLKPGEVVTRVRVPLQPWSGQMFRRFGMELSPESEPLTVCGLVRVSNGIVEEIRLNGTASGKTLLRSRTMEAELVGRRIPLSIREVESAGEAFGELPAQLTDIQRDRFMRLLTWFLLNIQQLTTKNA
ncbi:MAG: FAD binding domain-containing protein [Spirochaetia bacterium]